MSDAQWGMVIQTISETLDKDQWMGLTAIYESRVLTAVGGCHTPGREGGGWVGRALGGRVHMQGPGRQALE